MSANRGRMIAALAAAAALVIVGVVIGVLAMRDDRPATPSGVKLEDLATSMAALPACTEVFVAGQTIDAAKGQAGCKGTQGTVEMGGYHTCADGRLLFTIDAPRGWGFGGDIFHQTIEPVAEDAAFSTAYHGCVS